ncbi:MAG TPA: hypothetical protein VJ436_11605, partial [Anaerolineales bacterium]|nr:hypothetical protein [Anaerolineales bacterium]
KSVNWQAPQEVGAAARQAIRTNFKRWPTSPGYTWMISWATIVWHRPACLTWPGFRREGRKRAGLVKNWENV